MTDEEQVQAQAQANRKAAERGERPRSYPSLDVLRVEDLYVDFPDRVDGEENDSPD